MIRKRFIKLIGRDIAIGIGLGLLLAAPIGLVNAHFRKSHTHHQQDKAKPGRLEKRSKGGVHNAAIPVMSPVHPGTPSASA